MEKCPIKIIISQRFMATCQDFSPKFHLNCQKRCDNSHPIEKIDVRIVAFGNFLTFVKRKTPPNKKRLWKIVINNR